MDLQQHASPQLGFQLVAPEQSLNLAMLTQVSKTFNHKPASQGLTKGGCCANSANWAQAKRQPSSCTMPQNAGKGVWFNAVREMHGCTNNLDLSQYQIPKAHRHTTVSDSGHEQVMTMHDHARARHA